MKKILFAFAFFVGLSAAAQVDSSLQKTALTLQVRDWLYVESLVRGTDIGERLYDSLKVRLRPFSSATATTTFKVDSISVISILALSRNLRNSPYATSVFVYTRINNALSTISNTYLQNQLQAMDDEATANYNATIKGELDRLKRAQ